MVQGYRSEIFGDRSQILDQTVVAAIGWPRRSRSARRRASTAASRHLMRVIQDVGKAIRSSSLRLFLIVHSKVSFSGSGTHQASEGTPAYSQRGIDLYQYTHIFGSCLDLSSRLTDL